MVNVGLRVLSDQCCRLHEHNVAFTELTTQRDTLIDAAAKILEQRAKARYLRADVSSLRYRVTDIQRHIASLRELNDNSEIFVFSLTRKLSVKQLEKLSLLVVPHWQHVGKCLLGPSA